MIKEAPALVRQAAVEQDMPPAGGRFILGRRASLLVSAGVVSQTLWTSAAPALTYGLYAEEWHLTHTVTAGIFAIYPIGVVVMLVGFGGISDQIGRRATMLAGLFASLTGALLFAVAPDVWWVFAGRALMGIGVGLAASQMSRGDQVFEPVTVSFSRIASVAKDVAFAVIRYNRWRPTGPAHSAKTLPKPNVHGAGVNTPAPKHV